MLPKILLDKISTDVWLLVTSRAHQNEMYQERKQDANKMKGTGGGCRNDSGRSGWVQCLSVLAIMWRVEYFYRRMQTSCLSFANCLDSDQYCCICVLAALVPQQIGAAFQTVPSGLVVVQMSGVGL